MEQSNRNGTTKSSSPLGIKTTKFKLVQKIRIPITKNLKQSLQEGMEIQYFYERK